MRIEPLFPATIRIQVVELFSRFVAGVTKPRPTTPAPEGQAEPEAPVAAAPADPVTVAA